MQITIDTNADSTITLRAIAALLRTIGMDRDNEQRIPTAAEVFGKPRVIIETDAPPNGIVPLPPGVDPAQVELRQVPPPPPAIDPDLAADYAEASGIAPPPPVTDAALADVREAVAAADVDASGAAFDPAIHSSARKKNANGLWKKRRGGPASVPPAGQASAPAPAAGHVPPPPPPAIPPPPGTPSPFRALAGKVSAAVESGKLTRERVREICVSVGSPDLMTLNAMPHLIPAADAAFTAAGC
jgi:hypothetical protein